MTEDEAPPNDPAPWPSDEAEVEPATSDSSPPVTESAAPPLPPDAPTTQPFEAGAAASPSSVVLDELGCDYGPEDEVLRAVPAQTQEWAAHLRSERLFILCAPDRSLLDDVARSMVKKADASAHSRLWTPEELVAARVEPGDYKRRGKSAGDGSPVERLEDLLSASRQDGEKRDLYLVVSALDSGAQRFVDSLPSSKEELDTAYERLRHLATYLLILVHTSRLPAPVRREDRSRRALESQRATLKDEWQDLKKDGVPGEHFPGRPYLPFHEINVVQHFAATYLQEPRLRSQLEQQVKDQLWGEDIEHTTELLRDFIERGSLAAEIQRIATETPGGVAEALIDQLREATTLDLLVLFVASHLPRINPDDFDDVIRVLIDGEMGCEDEPASAAEEASPERVAADPRSLKEQWEANADRVLESWGLEVCVAPDDGGRERQVIQWRGRRYQQRWLDLLRRSRYYFRSRQLGHLQDLSLILSESGRELFERLLDLLLDHAVVSSRGRARALVLGCVDLLLRPPPGSKPGAPHARPPAAMIARISILLREMQSRPPLRDDVRAALNALIGAPVSAANERAFQLIRALRGAPEFDDLYWLRQLCERGGADARQAVLCALRDDVLVKGPNAGPLLDRIDAWLPSAQSASDRLSQHQRVALDLVLALAQAITPIEGAPWPPESSLFDWTRDAEAAGSTPRLVRWLLHPQVLERLTTLWFDTVKMALRTLLLPRIVLDLRGVDEARLERVISKTWADVLSALEGIPARDLQELPGAPLPMLFHAVMLARWMSAALARGGADAPERLLSPFLTNLSQEQLRMMDVHWAAQASALQIALERLTGLGTPDDPAGALFALRRHQNAVSTCQRALPHRENT